VRDRLERLARTTFAASAHHCPGPPGRLSALSIFLCKPIFYGAFVWARRALNGLKWRFPAQAVPKVTPLALVRRRHPGDAWRQLSAAERKAVLLAAAADLAADPAVHVGGWAVAVGAAGASELERLAAAPAELRGLAQGC
jgi:hypothetical protein